MRAKDVVTTLQFHQSEDLGVEKPTNFVRLFEKAFSPRQKIPALIEIENLTVGHISFGFVVGIYSSLNGCSIDDGKRT